MRKKSTPNASSFRYAFESQRDKHINFPAGHENSPGNLRIDKNISDHLRQWQEEIEQGEEEKTSNQ